MAAVGVLLKNTVPAKPRYGRAGAKSRYPKVLATTISEYPACRTRGAQQPFGSLQKTSGKVRLNSKDSIPVAASLLGDPSDTASACLAQRLASKTKKQIFVSYNLQNTDSNFTLLIENRIKEEMMAFPEKF
ncbi:PREDICTED: proteasome assembly chaperone 4 [Calidris pugnax]|uniref:proteasome assembly chaperone 4 n=1 Tax=Calidris pugnax TaxID=198806 RepID=UPI00071CE1F8|nr:PREDICTED: proteasome assembly chaperone 4 [Calidris pugnax]